MAHSQTHSSFSPPSTPAHEFVVIHPYSTPQWEAMRQQCYDLRVAVFIQEQGFSIDDEFDDADDSPQTAHILLRLLPSGTPVGTIRGHKPPGKDYYKLSRLVLLKEYRKSRLGGALVLALHDWIKQDALQAKSDASDTTVGSPSSPPVSRHVAEVAVHSQLPVIGFYARYGYAVIGDQFEEDGAPHQKMVARLELHV